jgi:hypothetical protein
MEVGNQHFRSHTTSNMSSEMFVSNHYTIQCNNPELHLHYCENLKSQSSNVDDEIITYFNTSNRIIVFPWDL